VVTGQGFYRGLTNSTSRESCWGLEVGKWESLDGVMDNEVLGLSPWVEVNRGGGEDNQKIGPEMVGSSPAICRCWGVFGVFERKGVGGGG